jgi:uncharacterized protein with GYD domain
MPTYIVLGRFTEQGIRNVKQVPERARHAQEAAERLGGKMVSLHYTQGQYDFVATLDFPDEASAMTFLLSTGALGNVRTETLRAFTVEELSGFVARIP